MPGPPWLSEVLVMVATLLYPSCLPSTPHHAPRPPPPPVIHLVTVTLTLVCATDIRITLIHWLFLTWKCGFVAVCLISFLVQLHGTDFPQFNWFNCFWTVDNFCRHTSAKISWIHRVLLTRDRVIQRRIDRHWIKPNGCSWDALLVTIVGLTTLTVQLWQDL